MRTKGLTRHRVMKGSLATLAAAIFVAGAVWLFGNSPIDPAGEDSSENIRQPIADSIIPVRVDIANESEVADPPPPEAVADESDRSLGERVDAILAGNASIVEFIRNNIERARNGDSDAAFYVSQALSTCGADMMSFGMTVPILTNSNAVPATLRKQELEQLRPTASAYLTDKHEFYRVQAERKMDRAIECLELGQPEALLNQAQELALIATLAEHPLATIMMDNIDVDNLNDNDLSWLKEKSRGLLQNNKDREIFFYASTVSAVSLNLDRTFETLAWAIAACNYNSCDTLSRLYRGRCEIMSLQGEGDFCADDMTDYDYLMLKYPGQFDRARARAMEISSAIDMERWEDLGL